MKIIMVCLGNICRSPLAEGIMREKTRKYGLDWKIDSAGTGSWHIGQGPDPRSVAVAQNHQIDISYQRGQQIKPHHLDHYDLILTMDSSNYRDVIRLATTDLQKEKIKMIMDFVDSENPSNVPDPYWNDDGFEQVFQMLDKACEAIARKYQGNGG